MENGHDTQEILSADVLEHFRKEIKDARELLAFAISEGCRISDQTIEKIEHAQKFLHPDSFPLESDRADFGKAYRDLAGFLCPINIDGIRAKPHWQSPWLWALLILLVGFTSVEAWRYAAPSLGKGPEIVPEALSVGLIAVVLWVLYVFTGVVTNKKLNQIILFCYVFTFLSLLLSILPFFAFPFFPRVSGVMALSPIGVIQGCSKPPLSDQGKRAIPEEIRCGTEEDIYQWVMNIGGVISPRGTLGVPVKYWQDNRHSLTNVQFQEGDDYPRQGRWHIQGGLVVPLYVVILSLMGSAVSMTRKVPEYQRRTLDPKDLLTNAQAREYLVFQIMQVLSAPLIVVTAYYLFAPANPGQSVLLGFASGFASEPLLLAIRSLAEKLKPAETAVPSPITVTVNPPSASLQAGKQKQFAATVTATSNPGVIWSIDPPDRNAGVVSQDGWYTAPEKIDQVRVVTITARSVADPAKSGSAIIKLEL